MKDTDRVVGLEIPCKSGHSRIGNAKHRDRISNSSDSDTGFSGKFAFAVEALPDRDCDRSFRRCADDKYVYRAASSRVDAQS